MLLYGFAWINSGDANSFTTGFLRLAALFGGGSGANRYISGTAQYFSQLAQEYEVLEQALKYHLTARAERIKTATRVRVTWLKLGSVIFKMFYAIPDFTYALQSRHHRGAPSELGLEHITHISLTGFRSRRRAEPIDVMVSGAWPRSNYMDLAPLSCEAARAVMDTLAGFVPHIRGAVKGFITLRSGENYLAWPEEWKFRYCRYISGASCASQLLGPTVELELWGSSRDSTATRRAMEFWGVSSFKKRRIEELSGGQRVRVALASAMASDARAILLDHVDGQLDEDGRRLLNGWIDAETKRGGRLFIGRCSGMEGSFKAVHRRDKSGGSESCRFGDIVVDVEGLQLRRGNKTLLNEWSHSFREGELTLLVGPNGSGKTSLALAIGGALKPARGTITRSAPVGMSFQNAMEQVFSFTVGAELAVRPELAGAAESECASEVEKGCTAINARKSDEVVELSPATLRFLCVHSMLFKTRFMIFDEPTHALSPASVQELVDAVENLRLDGVGVLMITHDPSIWVADAVIDLRQQ